MGDPATDDLVRLRDENASLRARVEAAERLLDELQAESLQRRAEVRELVADVPAVVSRRAVVRELVAGAVHHPDKAGVAARAVRKLGRAPRKLVRILRRAR